jgi:pyruvate kinase
MIARLGSSSWIVALCPDDAVCQGLAFSFGVHPVHHETDPASWRDFARAWLREHRLPGAIALLAAGPSARNPDADHRLEFLHVGDALPSI